MPRARRQIVAYLLIPTVGIALLWAVFGWLGGRKPPGKLDPRDVGGYLSRLNRSRTPEAEAIRREIARGPADLVRERDRASAEGLPIRPEQLQAALPPSERNAALEYVQIRGTGMGLPPNLQPMGYRGVYTPAEVALARRALSANQRLLALICKATDKPDCVFQRNWKAGPGVLFPEYAQMRGAARLLETESYLLARDGRFDEAIAEQARGLRIARHAASDPSLIGYLVGIACEAITLDGLQGILYTCGLNAHAADQVRAAVAANRPRLSLRHALMGEYASMVRVSMKMMRPATPKDFASLAATEEMLGGASAQPQTTEPDWLTRLLHPSRWRPLPARFSPEERRFIDHLGDAAEARILHELHRQMDEDRKPDPQIVAFHKAYDPEAGMAPNDPARLFTGIIFPVFSQAAYNGVRAHAREEVLVAGAAVVGYRARHGRWPRRLQDALAPLPADPFTGAPLKYRRESKGFVVYSVGATGRFDGGKPGMKRDYQEAYFRWPAPPPVRREPGQ